MSTVSFWEREELLKADFLVIGGGIIGISAAISVKERQPSAEVVVLEREILPSGASSKNAGFACFGGLTELISDIKRIGERAAIDTMIARKKGFALLQSRLGYDGLGYEPCGGYELLWAKDSAALDRMSDLNRRLESDFGPDYFALRDDLILEFGFPTSEVKHLVSLRHEGSINVGRMIKNLALHAAVRGVRIITGAHVESLDSSSSGVSAKVKRHTLGDTLQFSAAKAIVATNASAPHLTGELDIAPGRGQVLITKPVKDLKWKGVYFFDEGYFYFRSVGDRVLFGGGRNLNFAGEKTATFDTTDQIQQQLARYLNTVVLPGIPYEIDLRWSGIMGFSRNHQPVVTRTKPNVIVAFGCNGMGVALGSLVGEQAAEEVLR